MADQVQRRRGTATEHNSFTGAAGEVTVNTTNDSLHVHDGATAGGFEAMRADYSNADTTANVRFGNTDIVGVLEVDAGSTDRVAASVSGTVAKIDLGNKNTGAGNSYIQYDRSICSIDIYGGVNGSELKRVRIRASTGDITFYADDGTTAGTFFDASTGNFVVGGTTAGATSAATLYADGQAYFQGASGTGVRIGNGSSADGTLTWGSSTGGGILSWDTDKALIFALTGYDMDFRAATGREMFLRVGTTTNLTLSGGSGSELAEFAGDVEVGGDLVVGGVDRIAPAASYTHIQVGDGATLIGNVTGTDGYFVSNATYATSGWTRTNTGFSSQVGLYNGLITFAATGTGAPGAVSFSEYGRFDTSGNLLVGKTATNFGVAGAELKATGRITATSSSTEPLLVNRLTSDGIGIGIYQDSVSIGTLGSLVNEFQIKSNGSGLVSINRDVDDSTWIYRETATSTDNVLNIATNVGGTDTVNLSIAADGDVTNTNNSYGAISDAKLKQDIEPATSQYDDVIALGKLLCKYRLIADVEQNGDEAKYQLGWIAQEVQKICPGLVKETPDMERVPVTKTRTVERQVTEQVEKEVERTEVVVKDGKAIQTTVKETVTEDVPVFDEIPLFHPNGKPVMRVVQEAKEAVYEDQIDPDTDEVVSVLVSPAQEEVKEQAIHREPRMETVEEEYTDYEERQIILEDGTPSVTLSIRHSVAHMKLFKAFEELAEKVNA